MDKNENYKYELIKVAKIPKGNIRISRNVVKTNIKVNSKVSKKTSLSLNQERFLKMAYANTYLKKEFVNDVIKESVVAEFTIKDLKDIYGIKKFEGNKYVENIVDSLLSLNFKKIEKDEEGKIKLCEGTNIFTYSKVDVNEKTFDNSKVLCVYTPEFSEFFKDLKAYVQTDLNIYKNISFVGMTTFEEYLQSIARLKHSSISFWELKAMFQCNDNYKGMYGFYNFERFRLKPAIKFFEPYYSIKYTVDREKFLKYIDDDSDDNCIIYFEVEDKRYIEAKSKKLLTAIEDSEKAKPYESVYSNEIGDYDKFVKICFQKISKQFFQFDNDNVISYFNDFVRDVDESILKMQGEYNNTWTPKTNYTTYFLGALDKKLEQSDTDGSTLDVEFYSSTVDKESYLAFAESMSYSYFSENAKSFIVKSFKKLGDVNSSLFADLFETYFLIICCYDAKGNNNAYIIAASDDLKILANTTFKSKIYHFLNSFDFLRFDAQDVMTFTDFLVKVQSDEIRLTKNEGETSE